MPKNVDIEIHLLARTQVEFSNVYNWLLDMGVSEDKASELSYVYGASSAESLVTYAAKQCYMSFEPGLNKNVTKVRDDAVEFIDNILKQGHGSVLEHVNFTFGINNVSRVFTGEMNRHRAGVAISERSMRYIRFEDCINWWLPDSIRANPNDDADLANRKTATRMIFKAAFEQMEKNYQALCDIWSMDEDHHNFHYKKTMTSCFRRIIGMGAATGGVWTFNVRALRHMLTMRCSEGAEEEIRHVALRMLEIMRNEEPTLFGDFDENARPKYAKV
jgi:thymidylate synthase (FAD)